MIARRITIALNQDDTEILDILTEASSDDDMTSVLRRSLRLAYAQHLANESDDLFAVVSKDQAPKALRILDGVGLMNKTSIERKFKRIR